MKLSVKNKPIIICLMGPTASGKTPLAIELVKRFPFEIISVDSAMVYCGMNIGTAKPTQEILQNAPHHLIDIIDPSLAYSAGQFRLDALNAIANIIKKKKIPLLVGGSMMYFRILQNGIAKLPKADADLRLFLQTRAGKEGWPALHAYLATLDPDAAKRIHQQDSQRIQRALEVYLLTGKCISTWQVKDTNPLSDYTVCNLALMPYDRVNLHARISERFDEMLKLGLIDEVKRLHERKDLHHALPAIRSVGYAQAWSFLDGKMTYEMMRERAIIATRQLAKHQITWLRSWQDLHCLSAESNHIVSEACHLIESFYNSSGGLIGCESEELPSCFSFET